MTARDYFVGTLGAIRENDLGNRAAAETTGRRDDDQRSYLDVTTNAVQRGVRLGAKTNDLAGDTSPLYASCIPDYRNVFIIGDDGDSYLAADWSVDTVNTGTAGIVAATYGQLQLDSASTTADNGIQIQHKSLLAPLAAGLVTGFGCRLAVSDGTANFGQMFAGLADTTTTIFASGVLDTASSLDQYAGFYVDAGTSVAGTVDFELYDDVTAENVAGVHTLVDATFVDLEFLFDGISTVEIYVNNAANASSPVTVADAPSVGLRPSFVMQSEGTDDPIMSIDWWYAFQTRAANTPGA